MSKPCNIPEEELNLQSNFKRRVVNTDINKNYFSLLKKHKDNFLIIDLIDERSPILKVDSGFITKSKDLVDSGILKQISTQVVPEFQVIGKWEAAFDKFVEEIKKIYKPEDIILHKAFMAERYRNVRGDFSNFRDTKLEFAKYHNVRLRHYYEYIENKLPGINIIELPFGSYYADQNHRWGLQPYHYEDDYYNQMYDKLNEIVKTTQGV
jgi:hypothetical protein